MFAILAATVLALTGYSQASTLRIIDGQVADPREYPFYVQLQYQDDFFQPEPLGICGGTIINEKYVLTAWHCTAIDDEQPLQGLKDPKSLKVRYDVKNVCNGGFKTVDVVDIHIPVPLPEITRNDIAILELEFRPSIAPSPSVNLPYPKSLEVGLEGVVIGLGHTDVYATKMPCTLRQLYMTVGPPNDAKNAFSTRPTDDKDDRNICTGDSGGPWLSKSDDEDSQSRSYTIYGVTSYLFYREYTACGRYAGQEKTYYTDVTRYLNWIYKTTGMNP